MLKFTSLAIGLIAVVSIAPAADAFTPNSNASAIEQPAGNLHAEVNVNVDIGIGSRPRPQPQNVIVVETPRPQQNVIVVETSSRGNSSWAESRRKQKFYKHGRSYGGYSKHRDNYDDDDD